MPYRGQWQCQWVATLFAISCCKTQSYTVSSESYEPVGHKKLFHLLKWRLGSEMGMKEIRKRNL